MRRVAGASWARGARAGRQRAADRGSLWVGLEAGPASLVLFHDWVGTLFALTYTLVGFFLMLYLILPSATAHDPARPAATSATSL